MRTATRQEYERVLAAIRWPQPVINSAARYVDVTHRHLGMEAAHKTTIYKRGKVQSVTYSVNQRFLEEDQTQ